MMLDFVCVRTDDVHLMTKVVSILERSRHRSDPRVAGAAKSLLASGDDRIAARAAAFLVTIAPSKAEIRQIAAAVLRRAFVIRQAFIASLVRRLGPAYAVVARDQGSQEFRDAGNKIDSREFDLLTRNIGRRVNAEREALAHGERVTDSVLPIFEDAIRDGKLDAKVSSIVRELTSYGWLLTVAR